MHKFTKWFFYYCFLALFLAGFSAAIYLIHLFLSRNMDWISILTLAVVHVSTSFFNIYLLFQKRRYETKISWLIACSIFPIIGPISYFIFAKKYSNRQHISQYFSQYQRFIEFNYEENKLMEKNPDFEDNLLTFSSKYFSSPIKKFNGDLLVDGHSFFEKLFFDIKNAKKYIFIDVYIIKDDFVWRKLKKLLIKKRKQGVEVKILVDSFGAYLIKTRQWIELRRKKIEVLLFNIFKVPFITGQSFYRNHRKVYLIDGKIAYTGGNNISEEYSGFDKNYGYWMDLNLRLEGEIVQTYCKNFLFHWTKWGKKNISKDKINSFCNVKDFDPKPDESKNIGVVIQNGPNLEDSLIEGFILKKIYSAKKNIKIFTPYFVPTQKILDALKDVLLAKIELEIFLPGRNDSKIIKKFNDFFARKLLKKGAKIYHFKEIFFHGKSIVIDDKIGMIGTSNLDYRSLFFQYETNLFFKGKILNEFLNHTDFLKKQGIIVEIKDITRVFSILRFFIFFLKTVV
ncbi:Cardiolipin synthase [Mesomycoplasma dispar]|uniref:Cardiolipin synthase n=2 Tax=Mesomycoplasma dispar TaxID=86660 RepID=A0AAJ5NM21_9BACT|nr:cardiolipin synthase [Mesomycoplasma dispar]VEU61178.1 Cardiolipin synthase [Mesomycoplasma dispar]